MPFANLVESIDLTCQTHLGGVEITYAPEVGDPVKVVGMFDNPDLVTERGDGGGVEQVAPSVVVRLKDLPVDPDDDNPTITVDGVDYTVRGRDKDGITGGSIRLTLRKVRG